MTSAVYVFGAFYQVKFKVIIIMYILIATLLIALGLLLWVFFLPFIFSLFCDVMPVFSIVAFPCGSDSKASAYNEGDLRSVPGLDRSPGEGNSNPLQ